MDNYTIEEKKFISSICMQISAQLGVEININDFKKYTSPMWKEVTIELKHPQIIKNRIFLYIQMINNVFSFELSFYNDNLEYRIYWYKYLRLKYNKDVELYMNSSNKYIKWIVSEIRSAIEENKIIVSVSSQGKEIYDKEINLQEVLNECKILTK